MSDYNPRVSSIQDQRLVESLNEVCQEILQVVDEALERAIAAISSELQCPAQEGAGNPYDIEVSLPQEPDHDFSGLVSVREIPVLPLSSVEEFYNQSQTQHPHIVLSLADEGNSYGITFEDLLQGYSDIDRGFWSESDSHISGWSDSDSDSSWWSDSHSDGNAWTDLENEEAVPCIQSPEATINDSDSVLEDYETMLSSEMPPLIAIDSNESNGADSSYSSMSDQQTAEEDDKTEPPFMELIRSVREKVTNEQTSLQPPCCPCSPPSLREKTKAVRPSQRSTPYSSDVGCSNLAPTSCKRKADIQQVIIDEEDSDSDSSEVFPPPPPLYMSPLPKRRRVHANDDLYISPLTPCDELRYIARDLHFKLISINLAVNRMQDIFSRAEQQLEFWARRNIECSHMALMLTISKETVLQLIYSLMIEQVNPSDNEDNNDGPEDDNGEASGNAPKDNEGNINGQVADGNSIPNGRANDGDSAHDAGTDNNQDNSQPMDELDPYFKGDNATRQALLHCVTTVFILCVLQDFETKHHISYIRSQVPLQT